MCVCCVCVRISSRRIRNRNLCSLSLFFLSLSLFLSLHSSTSTRPITARPSPKARERNLLSSPTLTVPPRLSLLASLFFQTHDWGTDERGRSNHDRVISVAERLKACGLRVWIDEYEMTGDIVSKMCEAIEDSATIGVFITQRYVQKVRAQAD